ncbi:hypothetical protein D1641_09585 [Colidextribacter sp. OB.20]|uniref:leucine-rich repeat protein n=1 Tax=Colidextribacter sp. OB.20 TaxID=2304568 RepID=UPI001370BCCE|nr:leucine-rich repeat protein [Colidextribacter sp. OB.20]NBI10259.1 hypothetical protein [Colidextribacter sp. OB.20]
MLFVYAALAGFVLAVVSAVLMAVMAMRDKPFIIPLVLMLVSILVVGGSVFMITREDNPTADKSTGDQSTVDQSNPDKSNYIPAPTKIYNTSADENGLGDTNMYVDGTVKSFDSKKGVKYCEFVTEDGKLQIISVPLGTPKDEWDKLKEGEQVRIYFQYLGYSDVLDMASGMLLAVGNPSDDKATISGTPYIKPEDSEKEENGIWANKFTPINDFRYTLDKQEKTITLIRYSGDEEKIMLSPVYTIGGEDYKLTSLGDDGCFFGEISLTSIYIPEGVTHFSNNCFNSCSSLQYLYIPSTMKDMEMSFLDYIHEHKIFCDSKAVIPAERDTKDYDEKQDDMSQAGELGSNFAGAINGLVGGISSDPDNPIVTEIYFGGTAQQWESYQ